MELADWLSIVLEYLKVLAWPAMVLTLALIFRRPLIDILVRLQKASGWGAQLELRQEIREAAEDSATTPEAIIEAATEPPIAPPAEKPSATEQSAESSKHKITPRSSLSDVRGRDGWRTDASIEVGRAAVEALVKRDRDRAERRAVMLIRWYELEDVARRLGEKYGLPPHARRVADVASFLATKKHFSPEIESVVERLTDIRERLNDAGREDLTPQAANDFINATNNIRVAFERDEERYFPPADDSSL
ncbi:hypothetical protein [Microbacterium paraoxydans]|uniref:DUF4129 domain-containing protein n=1 Tax=Microbacterium paraoxydans TaxID=199592 RepID=A0ABS5IPC7_9MICO|nr:hypothetical protein [Microbacterium paraoxydans]MBS0024117.1 hypothetical protein [Microbacterium paraoxydans]